MAAGASLAVSFWLAAAVILSATGLGTGASRSAKLDYTVDRSRHCRSAMVASSAIATWYKFPMARIEPRTIALSRSSLQPPGQRPARCDDSIESIHRWRSRCPGDFRGRKDDQVAPMMMPAAAVRMYSLAIHPALMLSTTHQPCSSAEARPR